jgi:hypothetical protein
MGFGDLKHIKASKKVFHCMWCFTDCLVKEPRVYFFGTWEGEIQNWHMHPECYDASKREDLDGNGEIHDEKHPRGMTCEEARASTEKGIRGSR